MLMDRSERAIGSISPRLVQRQRPAGKLLGMRRRAQSEDNDGRDSRLRTPSHSIFDRRDGPKSADQIVGGGPGWTILGSPAAKHRGNRHQMPAFNVFTGRDGTIRHFWGDVDSRCPITART
jgi:hypothetical protein